MTSQTKIDFDEALAGSGPKVRHAFEASHAVLVGLGAPHLVIGGLAVNAHGHYYSTRDVDYFIDAKDVFVDTGVLSFRPGIPYSVDGVLIDYLPESPRYPPLVRDELRRELALAQARPDKIGIVSDWLLVWMKLDVGRSKDIAAVEGLVQAGLDVDSVRAALLDVGDPRVVELFERCVQKAEADQ